MIKERYLFDIKGVFYGGSMAAVSHKGSVVIVKDRITDQEIIFTMAELKKIVNEVEKSEQERLNV